MLFTISGCKESKDNKEEVTKVVQEKITTKNNEATTVMDDDQNVVKKAYAKLANNDKESVVNVDEAVVNKIDINKEKSISLVHKNEKITGEIFKIIYKTNDPVLGDLVVYYDSSNDEIVAYGLRD